MQKNIRRALISVFYKDKIAPLAEYLNKEGVEILSTGGTRSFLENLGIAVTPVESITGYPSILDGRVKTLHPAIFGGILNRTGNEQDDSEIREHGIPEIDLVMVDLYPFAETLSKTDDEAQLIEKIDIGGVSLIRAGAKNFRDKLIIADTGDCAKVLSELQSGSCSSSLEFRQRMAARAFEVTAAYDDQIAAYFNRHRDKTLRYGENPHQKAVFRGNLEQLFVQLNGKELSYNNLLDIDAAINLMEDYLDYPGATVAILKHNNACGLACSDSNFDAYKKALEADPVSAFGGIIISDQRIDRELAEEMNSLFFEILLAPGFDEEALEILKGKKNRIILQTKALELPEKQVRSVLNGLLVQDRDVHITLTDGFSCVTERNPDPREIDDLFFANILVKHTKSNAIVLAKGKQLLASGTGQTSRVDALEQAIQKARKFGFDLEGAVMASDAFFPFPDCVEIADKVGIRSVIQPGGSINDQKSIDYCNAHDMTMVLTGHRHFRH
ncbi:MAG: bifunctional phosphoribosylaminoimidazolecarboxamide formyltransferase/IMP cyclohydrolase [Flavobacteriales bacterium]|nr:bifunctional phosphoribosylaminoimidazolecarboxamide formyltransferase/IMP cyclohydrolase [Flavobacteriales bacterium]